MHFTIGYLTKTLIKLFKKDFKDKNFILLISNFCKQFVKYFCFYFFEKKKIVKKNFVEKMKSKKKYSKKASI